MGCFGCGTEECGGGCGSDILEGKQVASCVMDSQGEARFVMEGVGMTDDPNGCHD